MRLASALVSLGIATALAPLPAGIAHAADTIDTLATAYVPVLGESVDASGFRHPGIGLTRDALTESVEIDQVPHHGLLHSTDCGSVPCSAPREHAKLAPHNLHSISLILRRDGADDRMRIVSTA